VTLPASGSISLSQILAELRIAVPGRALPIRLGDADVRTLAGVPSGAISLSNLRGKSAVTPVPINAAFGPFQNNVVFAAGIRTSTLTFQTDGTTSVSGPGSSTQNWSLPTTSNISANVWVRITSSGTNTNYAGSIALNTWTRLDTAKTFSVSNTLSNNEGFGTTQFEFASDASGTTLLGIRTGSYDVGFVQ
jgi:hypothetical protein